MKKTTDQQDPDAAENMPEDTSGKAGSPAEGEDNREPSASAVDETAKLEAELAAMKDKYIRLYSEFENFRKRTQKERIELIRSAGEELFIALLPVLDDFDRAMKSFQQAKDLEALKEGVVLIHNKFRSILQQKGLKEMNSAGTVFDTDLHEAITKAPAPEEELKGKVVEELEKGYYLNDKVIRYAKVVIGE